MMNELCYILIGKRIGRFWFGRMVRKTVGTVSLVEFDWEWVLRREEEKGDVLGFWHTHETDIRPSVRDADTMRAWVRCFNKELLCLIRSNNYQARYLCARLVERKVEKKPWIWKRLSRFFRLGSLFVGVEQ